MRPLLLAVLLLLASSPLAQAGEPTQVDWQRGLLVGRAAAAGDLRSPSRQLARVKAERVARNRCKNRLVAAAARLQRAPGVSATKELSSLGDTLILLSTDYGTDGSVVVEMGLPLDAMRSLLVGPDPILVGDSGQEGTTGEGPSVLLVDARALGLRPAIGFKVADNTGVYQGPTLFFASEEQARADKRVGGAKLHVAVRTKKGTIWLPKDALKSQLAARPLVAILWAKDKTK